MHIEKWYADIVDDGVQIHYRANLQLGLLTIGYSSTLGNDRPSAAKAQLRRMAMPVVSGNAVHWPVETNEPAIEWTGVVSLEQELWRHGNHVLSWNPLVLNGGVKVAGRHSSTRGYVERLTLNFSPWDLGLKKLKWGRFCGRKHSLVWIEWEGRIPNRLALLDGATEPLLDATRLSVRTQRVRLAMNAPKEIVDAPLGSGALRVLGLIKIFVARQFLTGIETKWLAEGVLDFAGGETDHGHVVYEEVVWA